MTRVALPEKIEIAWKELVTQFAHVHPGYWEYFGNKLRAAIREALDDAELRGADRAEVVIKCRNAKGPCVCGAHLSETMERDRLRAEAAKEGK